MVANFTKTAPQNVRETINWLIRLGRPPLPECPIEAAKQGKEPHSASLRCGECDRFIKWVGKSELAKIQNQGGQR